MSFKFALELYIEAVLCTAYTYCLASVLVLYNFDNLAIHEWLMANYKWFDGLPFIFVTHPCTSDRKHSIEMQETVRLVVGELHA